jgi:hypothetical protein
LRGLFFVAKSEIWWVTVVFQNNKQFFTKNSKGSAVCEGMFSWCRIHLSENKRIVLDVSNFKTSEEHCLLRYNTVWSTESQPTFQGNI